MGKKEREENIAVSLGHWGKENLGTMGNHWTLTLAGRPVLLSFEPR